MFFIVSPSLLFLGENLAAWKETAVMDKRTVLQLTPMHIRAMGFPQ